MNLVQRVQPLLALIGLDDGRREVAIETRPALPMWQPTGQPVERTIERIIRDGNVTIFEREVVYLEKPASAAIRERHDGPGPRFVNCDGEPASPALIAKYYAGEYGVVDEAPEVPVQSWER